MKIQKNEIFERTFRLPSFENSLSNAGIRNSSVGFGKCDLEILRFGMKTAETGTISEFQAALA